MNSVLIYILICLLAITIMLADCKIDALEKDVKDLKRWRDSNEAR